jgi:hypothetical protein
MLSYVAAGTQVALPWELQHGGSDMRVEWGEKKNCFKIVGGKRIKNTDTKMRGVLFD